MRRRLTIAAALLGALALLGAGCSSDDDDTTDDTTGGTAAVEVDDGGDLTAQATDAAVAYFTNLSVNDFDEADAAAGGAAADVVDWNRQVSGIDAVADSAYGVPAKPSPDVATQLGALVEDDGTWVADGYLQLSELPGGVVPQTTTTAAASDTTATTTIPATAAFVTELTFERDEDDELVLVDYRYDSVPYPVSALYVDTDEAMADDGEADEPADATTSDTAPAADAADIEVAMMRRDMDGSVQYLLAHEPGARITAATLTPGDDPGADPIELEVFSDAVGESDGDVDALAVSAGGFPGEPGTVEATLQVVGSDAADDDATDVTAPAGTETATVEVPAFPELGPPAPVGAIRDRLEAESTPDDASTTTSSTATTSTTTEDGPEVVPVPVPVPGDAPSSTTSTTAPGSSTTSSSSSPSSSSTTSTTTAG